MKNFDEKNQNKVTKFKFNIENVKINKFLT